MDYFKGEEAQIAYRIMGQNEGPVVVWAHGWGQSHAAYLPFVQSFEKTGRHILIDFPGFGQSPPPTGVWGSAEYADFAAAFIKSQTGKPVIWIGHSFGCRVGLQLAIRHPDLIAGLILIGAAGLRRKRTLMQKLVLNTKVYTFKTLKKLIPFGVSENWLKSKFGSPDYRNAGPIRPIMVKVNHEDMTAIVPQIKCPVLLAYGTKDNETPLEIGERLNKLIRNSELLSFDGLDHYTILGEGRHQLAPYIKQFIDKHGRKNV